MNRRDVILILASTAVTGFISGIRHQLEIDDLNNSHMERLDKYIREHGRNMYVSGFDDCNSRNHYSIPREQYPKFD